LVCIPDLWAEVQHYVKIKLIPVLSMGFGLYESINTGCLVVIVRFMALCLLPGAVCLVLVSGMPVCLVVYLSVILSALSVWCMFLTLYSYGGYLSLYMVVKVIICIG